jgi:ATP-binding cassette, subfamily B, bacterial
MTVLGKVVRHAVGLAWRADRRAVCTVIALVIAQAFATAMTAQGQRLVTTAVTGHATLKVLAAAALGGIGYAISAAGYRVNTTYQADLNERVDLALHNEILTRVTALSTIEHLERREYLDRLALLREHTSDVAGFSWAVADSAAAIISVFLSLALLIGVSPFLGLLALTALPPLWAMHFSSQVLAGARAKCARDLRVERQLHQLCVDPSSAKEIAVCGAAAALSEQADAARGRITQEIMRWRVKSCCLQALGWSVYAAGYVGSLALTAHLVSTGAATLGDLVLVVSLGAQLQAQVSRTVTSFARAADASHAVRNYMWLVSSSEFGEEVAKADPPTALGNGLSLRHVSFCYPGSSGDNVAPALHDVSLDLPAGKVIALVGPNGAGKTTLINLLTCMFKPTTGEITVDAAPLDGLDPAKWRSRVFCVLQDFMRFQLPVREAVGIGDLRLMDDDESIRAALDYAGAAGMVDSLPQNLETQLGDIYGGIELSHGQWQRLAIARAAMRKKPLLFILDEPSAALDPQAEHDLYERFTRFVRGGVGHVAVLVSHRFSSVQMADHIVVMSHGRVVEQGSHAELLRRRGSYAEMYAMQTLAYR